MNQYLFIFGRKPLLSLAEIISVFPDVSVKNFEKDKAILKFRINFENIQKTLNQLGGTKTIAKEINDPSVENLIEIIKNRHKNQEKKIIFSMTLESLTREDKHSMKNLLKKIKKKLNEEGRKSRYQEKYLGGEGTHFIAYYENKKLKTGLIEAIQDFKAYSQRDYEKPFRDTKSGMLPPKLAQIMINLGGIKKTNAQKTPILYDPFCGSGTILMEASLMGFDVVGSDIDEKAVEGAKRNVAQVKNAQLNAHLFIKDAKELAPSDLPIKPDIIVSESYLGPFFSQKPTLEKITKIQKELEKLYLETLEKLRLFNITIVLALPCHKIENQYRFLPNMPAYIKKTGFKIEKIFPSEIMPEIIENYIKKYGNPTPFGFVKNRNTFLYDRPDQNIAREIFILKPI